MLRWWWIMNMHRGHHHAPGNGHYPLVSFDQAVSVTILPNFWYSPRGNTHISSWIRMMLKHTILFAYFPQLTFWPDAPRISYYFLDEIKVSKSQKQIMVSSILPKSKQMSLSWVLKVLRIVGFIRLFLWSEDAIICFRDLLTFSGMKHALDEVIKDLLPASSTPCVFPVLANI